MKKKSAIIIAVFAIGVSVIAIVFAAFPPIAAFKSGSARLLRPMMRVADRVSRTIGSRAHAVSFSTCASCDEERVGREVAEVKLATAAGENESLEKMLGLKRQFAPWLTPARVMLYNQEWDREWLVIDAGEEDGVRRGDMVIDEHQFLVGEVAEVSSVSATVAIASNNGTAFSIVLASSGAEALAHGLGGRAFRLELIPRDTAARPGDMAVRASKSNRKIPQIFAGRIVRVDDRAGGAFKIGTAVLLSHPERIDRVMVISVR